MAVVLDLASLLLVNAGAAASPPHIVHVSSAIERYMYCSMQRVLCCLAIGGFYST